MLKHYVKSLLALLLFVFCFDSHAIAKSQFEEWSYYGLKSFTQETNYTSQFGYLRYIFLSSKPLIETDGFVSLSGTIWGTFSNIAELGKTETTRYILLENGQVEIHSTSTYFKNDKLELHISRRRGVYFWEQRGEMIRIRGGFTYSPDEFQAGMLPYSSDELQPGDISLKRGVDYIGFVSQEPVSDWSGKRLQIKGLMRYTGAPSSDPSGWLAIQLPVKAEPTIAP